MSERQEHEADRVQVSKGRPLLSIAIVLLVILGIYFVVLALPLDVLGDIRARSIAWRTLPLIALLQLVFLFVAADIWRRVVRVSTGTGLSFWSSYLQIAMVSIGKYVPGKVWGFVARAGDMYGKQIPVHLAVMSSVVEQMLVVAGALLVATIAGLIAMPDHRFLVTIAGVSLFALAIIACSKIPAITEWLLRRRKIQQVPDTAADFHTGGVIRFTFAYGVLWILSGAIFSTIYFSLFNAAVTLQSVAALTLANTAGIVFGFFAFFVPGGIGVREAVATIVLSGFVPVREALLAAICYRAWMILIDGFNALLVLGREASTVKSE